MLPSIPVRAAMSPGVARAVAIDPPSGCRFHPRCPEAMPECADVNPELVHREREPTEGSRITACHLYDIVEDEH
jgi:oligopeptide/dipeptide ABC transporter ATP-binding protein